jgi:Yip1 domain
MTEFKGPAESPIGESLTVHPLGQGERIIDTFIAPSKTFTDILRDQSWWLPFLLAIVVSYGYMFVVQKQVGWDTVAQNTLNQDPKASERLANASPEAKAQALTFTLAIIKYTFFASPLLALVFAAIVSLVLWATINLFFGGHATFGRVFAVWMYGTLPVLIKSILAIITLFAGLDKDAFNLSNPVGTNIGYFLPVDSAKWLTTLATSVDMIWIWTMILVGIGLAIVAKVKRGSGLIAVFGWWLFILLVRVGYAAIAG